MLQITHSSSRTEVLNQHLMCNHITAMHLQICFAVADTFNQSDDYQKYSQLDPPHTLSMPVIKLASTLMHSRTAVYGRPHNSVQLVTIAQLLADLHPNCYINKKVLSQSSHHGIGQMHHIGQPSRMLAVYCLQLVKCMNPHWKRQRRRLQSTSVERRDHHECIKGVHIDRESEMQE